jgi:hypothetical protein
MAIKITCINKDNGNHENPNVAITHLGWVKDGDGTSGKSTRLEMYNWIKNDKVEAYVKDGQGNKAKLITAETIFGTKYVKTEADTSTKNNLLSLPEC